MRVSEDQKNHERWNLLIVLVYNSLNVHLTFHIAPFARSQEIIHTHEERT